MEPLFAIFRYVNWSFTRPQQVDYLASLYLVQGKTSPNKHKKDFLEWSTSIKKNYKTSTSPKQLLLVGA